jgi:hypothetical protein
LNFIFISPHYLFVAMADLYVQLAVVLVYSVFLNQVAFPIFPSLIILTTGFGWFLIRKTTQLMTSYLKTFFLEPANVLDIIQFALLAGSITIVYLGEMNEGGWTIVLLSRIDRLVLTSATCVSWLKLLFVIGNLYYSVAVFVAAVITVSIQKNKKYNYEMHFIHQINILSVYQSRLLERSYHFLSLQ